MNFDPNKINLLRKLVELFSSNISQLQVTVLPNTLPNIFHTAQNLTL
ncbi:MAG: hypothetical protein LBJ00_07040 [Planctomycetaceae bacterium]|jgi:hypothetical protein|nr:hypothetical protein [Planctomycetaceae bacterium]